MDTRPPSSTLEPTETEVEEPVADLELLVREARARQRRRRLRLLAGLLGGVALAGIVYGSIAGHKGGAGLVPIAHRPVGPASTGRVTPDQPVALAVSPGGDLFIADAGRNEILGRMPSGTFRVVAGTGVAGLSGDGGPAVRAEVRDPFSLALTPDGALYFTQPGRYRHSTVIREITPAGTIQTVAGLHPDCASGAVHSVPAESALFHGASLAVSPTGGLAVDGQICVGNIHEQGFGPNLLLTPSGRFIKNTADAIPAVASIDCGSGVPGQGFQVFSCASGGGGGPDGHGPELLVVRSDGSSVAYPENGPPSELALGDGEVVATHNGKIVRVTSNRLVPLVSYRRIQRTLGLSPKLRGTDVLAPAVGRRGEIYFVTSSITGRGCRDGIVERTATGTLHRIWGSSPGKNNVCY